MSAPTVHPVEVIVMLVVIATVFFVAGRHIGMAVAAPDVAVGPAHYTCAPATSLDFAHRVVLRDTMFVHRKRDSDSASVECFEDGPVGHR